MKSWYQHVFESIAAGKKLRVASALIVSMLTVMFMLTAGVAASSPNTTTIYYACVNNTTGAITIVSKSTVCKTGYHKIQWNQQGPAGPAGPQGPQGPQGPSGLCQGYSGIRQSGNTINLGSFSNPTAVVSTNPVAAGHYLVTATALVHPDNTSLNDQVYCYIATASNSSTDFAFGGSSVSGSYDDASVTDFLNVSAGDHIVMYCFSNQGDSNSFVNNATITALALNVVSAHSFPALHPGVPGLPKHR